MVNKERGEVKVVLDKERTLKFTLNSLVFAEEAGIDIANMGKNQQIKLKDLRTLLYAGLMHEDAELTPEHVGEMIEISKIGEISEALNEAFGSVGK